MKKILKFCICQECGQLIRKRKNKKYQLCPECSDELKKIKKEEDMENGKELNADLNEIQVIPEEENLLSEKKVEKYSQQIELRKKMLMIALKALKPHDFQDFGGKPYLEGEGAARIMAVIRGFQVAEPKFEIENIEGHYFIECQMLMSWCGQSTVAFGDCSTTDPFFTGKDGNAGILKKHLDRTGSEILAKRLIVGDAKKKARENAISRGVSELMGIKGLTWEDLKELGFLKSGAGAQVDFKNGSQGGQIKTLSVIEAVKQTKGSKINISGVLKEIKTRTVTGGKEICDYHLLQEGIKISVSKWGSPVEGLSENDEIFCEKVTVGEYKGRQTFVAESIAKIEKGA